MLSAYVCNCQISTITLALYTSFLLDVRDDEAVLLVETSPITLELESLRAIEQIFFSP